MSSRTPTWIVPRPLRRFFKQASELHPVTLRFVDPEMGRSFHEAYFRDNLPYIRLAHVLAVAVWAAFGPLARYLLEDGRGGTEDLVLRYGIAIPIVLVSLATTYARWYPRVWQQVLVAVLLVNGMLWSLHRAVIPDASAEWAFAGLVLILAFNYVLSRVQFVYTAVIGVVLIAFHNVVAVAFAHDTARDLIFVDFFLVGYAAIGMVGAYVLERFMRLLYLREHELEAEHRRADDLLANTLPSAIIRRLKERHAEPETTSIADALPNVSVVFADLEAFTAHATRIGPDELVAILDDVFIRFDELADRLGMEKIKTVGDAYMAVAGAPEPSEDNAQAAAEMAIGIQATMAALRWPSGEPMRVRVGIATGPVVAGVIGRRKFAYDLWGDTVNRASRLETHGVPGRTLVDETTAELLDGAFALSEPCVIELKGRGPTVARFLLGHEDAVTSERHLDAVGEPAASER
jgi:class 3 adenylate cyclase